VVTVTGGAGDALPPAALALLLAAVCAAGETLVGGVAPAAAGLSLVLLPQAPNSVPRVNAAAYPIALPLKTRREDLLIMCLNMKMPCQNALP